ncbi:MAG: hypothetical protein KDC02_25240 [Flavobacteriales bacterium]|nr:hypothetical protein [Flavobacteriales bacterium]
MRTFLAAALLAFSAFTATAQKHVYEDLLVLYVDEEYEKCLAQAENYTLKDDTRRDPLPYLYMSMSLFEMSKDEKYAEDYAKADRDALKYAEKYRKKDKELEFFRNYEDYWAELNTRAMEEGENLMEDPKGMSKAKSLWDAMTGYYPENPGPWLMLAVVQYKSNLAKEGDLSVKAFDKALADAGEIKTLPPDQRKLLKNAIIRYADYQQSKGMRDQAKKYVALGKDDFMDQPDFKGLYESLF